MLITTIKNYRWFIVVLLFVATTINYIDRQIIGLKVAVECSASDGGQDHFQSDRGDPTDPHQSLGHRIGRRDGHE